MLSIFPGQVLYNLLLFTARICSIVGLKVRLQIPKPPIQATKSGLPKFSGKGHHLPTKRLKPKHPATWARRAQNSEAFLRWCEMDFVHPLSREWFRRGSLHFSFPASEPADRFSPCGVHRGATAPRSSTAPAAPSWSRCVGPTCELPEQ